jgi:predicted O-linked N-acetylglucosamine transferase (SPINDLY family)
MDISMYILACFKIVPIQIATSGHPETSGLLSMDYFVSSSVFEKCNDVNYIEELILFDSINTYYYNPNNFVPFNIYDMVSACNKSILRSNFHFPTNYNIYGISCPCLKISPQFEKIIHKLLIDDPTGILIMTEDINPFYFKKIIERFNKNMSYDICNRIYTVPFINNPELFYKFIYSADVMLDPHPFGGLISTIDIFSCGRSIITMPGEKLYGRFTAGAYKYMGLSEDKASCLIAENINDYVKKAIQIATDSLLRESIEKDIIKLLPNIFEDTKTIDDWSSFLHSL